KSFPVGEKEAGDAVTSDFTQGLDGGYDQRSRVRGSDKFEKCLASRVILQLLCCINGAGPLLRSKFGIVNHRQSGLGRSVIPPKRAKLLRALSELPVWTRAQFGK